LSDEQYENADSSIRGSFDVDSKVTDERELHDEKQDLQIISTEAGIQID
jgi:hypothetical protein